MRKRLVIELSILALVSLVLFGYWLNTKIVTFYYLNPYTETSGMKYIATTIKKLNNTLDKARDLAASSDYKYNYIYTNAYGSGFIKNNPIPNDLDFDVFIDLGTFDYNNDKTKHDVADEMVKKMDFFQESLIFAINQNENLEFLPYRTQTGQYRLSKARHEKYVAEIENSLDNALSQKEYVNHLTKIAKGTDEVIYYMPYLMNEGKLIIKDYDLMMFFNDDITYNENMPKYLRELSIGLAFSAKVKKGDKVITVEFVPELFSTGPLGLADRLYAPNVFFRRSAVGYLNKFPELSDNQHFVASLLYCAFDHLLVLEPKDAFEYNPLKALKRIVEINDMLEPGLDADDVAKSNAAIAEEWQNRDIQLLNEYNNLVTNLTKIYIRPVPYLEARKTGKLKVMMDTLDRVLAEMDSRKNISKEHMKVFHEFRDRDINIMLNDRNYLDLNMFAKNSYDKKYRRTVAPVVADAVFAQIKNKDIIKGQVAKLKQLFTDAGYRYMRIYIAGIDTIELEDDEFTRGIKDFKDFASKNELAQDMNFKLVKKENIPKTHLKYDIWVRYNTTPEQDAYFEKLKQALIDAKPKYKIRSKSYFVW